LLTIIELTCLFVDVDEHTPEHDDVGDEIYDSINPMETIRKALRKENRELIELARCKPLTEEGKERMKF
jgi:hypothetical protein